MTERKVKSSKIRIGDISISYHSSAEISNDKNTILFLHGFPFNKNSWRKQVEDLSAIANCIAIDIRGHGNTTLGHGFLSIDVFARDLIVFIEKLKLTNIILCGVSMGGYIALRAYELNSDLFCGLILSDTHAMADTNEIKQNRFDTVQAVLHYGRRPFAIGFIAKLFTPSSIDNNLPAIELIKSSIRRNGISTICSTLLALASRTDTQESLKRITVPSLLIRGAEDKITTYSQMEEMHKGIPKSIFVEIQDAGHLPNLEQPYEFNRIVSDFVKSI